MIYSKICQTCDKPFETNWTAKKYCTLTCKPSRGYEDRRLGNIAAVKKRRLVVRQRAIEYKGGKCERCGYSKCYEALEFHHKDPTQKDFGISAGPTRSWATIQQEIEKCELVCANCHREIHYDLRQKPKSD